VGVCVCVTRSSVFFALSETKGRAMGGMASEAGMVVFDDKIARGRANTVRTLARIQ